MNPSSVTDLLPSSEDITDSNISLKVDDDTTKEDDTGISIMSRELREDFITNELSSPSVGELKPSGKTLIEPLKEAHQSSKGENIQVERAVRFLLHPSIAGLPLLTKDSYLRSKGLSERDILRAKDFCETSDESLNHADSVWNSTDDKNKSEIESAFNKSNHDLDSRHTSRAHFLSHRPESYNENFVTGKQLRQGSAYPMDMEPLPSPELPNPFVPLSIGGILTIFGLAALRWLNGGEFVLFLPPSVSNSFQSDETVEPDDEVELYENEKEISNNTESIVEGETTNFLSGAQGKFEANDKNGTLSCEVQNLTRAIEHYSLLQERVLKMDSEGKARNMTNNAMNLLRQDSSKANESKLATKENSSKDTCSISVLVQLTELKCAIQSMAQNITKDNPCDDEKYNKLLNTLEKTASQLSSIKSIFLQASENAAILNDEIHGNVSVESIPTVLGDRKELETGMGDEIKVSASEDGNYSAKTKEAPILPNPNEQAVVEQAAIPERTIAVGSQALLEALNQFKESNPKATVESCAQMLFLYTSNLLSNPTLPRYKKVYTNNSTYKKKVRNVAYANKVLHAIGFVDQGSHLEWKGDELFMAQESSHNTESSQGVVIDKKNGAIKLVKEALDALNLLKSGEKE